MPIGQLILDTALFAGTVALAAVQRWDAKDLIWGLWISSLTLGYASIVMGVTWSILTEDRTSKLRGAVLPLAASRGVGSAMSALPNVAALWAVARWLPLVPATIPVIVLLGIGILAPVSVAFPIVNGGRPLLPPEGFAYRLLTRWPLIGFMIGFFTIHFVGFHFGHGLFLNQFFPIVPGATAGSELQLAVNFIGIVSTAAGRYWTFLAASAVSFLPVYVADLKAGRWTFFSPYKNVIRMHLLIFVFAFLFAAKLHNWAVYPVLLLYFFPWGSLKALVRKRRSRPWASPPEPADPAILQQDGAERKSGDVP